MNKAQQHQAEVREGRNWESVWEWLQTPTALWGGRAAAFCCQGAWNRMTDPGVEHSLKGQERKVWKYLYTNKILS